MECMRPSSFPIHLEVKLLNVSGGHSQSTTTQSDGKWRTVISKALLTTLSSVAAGWRQTQEISDHDCT